MYVDGYLYAVPTRNREALKESAGRFAEVLRDHGATRVVECWGDDVPDGKVTSMPLAVKLRPDETVCFSWAEFPDKETRDRCHKAAEADPRIQPDVAGPDPFDGARLIYGSFIPFVEK